MVLTTFRRFCKQIKNTSCRHVAKTKGFSNILKARRKKHEPTNCLWLLLAAPGLLLAPVLLLAAPGLLLGFAWLLLAAPGSS